MRFTNGFSVYFLLLIIIIILLVLFVSSFGAYTISQNMVAQYCDIITQEISQAVQSDSVDKLFDWLPNVMKACNMRQIDVNHGDQIIAQFQALPSSTTLGEVANTKLVKSMLPYSPDHSLLIEYNEIDPNKTFGFRPLVLIIVVILLSGLLVFANLHWVMPKFQGIYQLNRRARMILAGKFESTKEEYNNHYTEWPRDISRSIDVLSSELEKSHKEIARLSSLIRIFVTQDPETGVSSALAFQNRLTAQLEEPNSHGLVMMVRLPDFELYRKPLRDNTSLDNLQEALISILTRFTKMHSSTLLARYFNNDFVILLPNYSSTKDIDNFASQIISRVNTLSSVNMLSTDSEINHDALVFIGATAYYGGQSIDAIVDYVTHATRVAEIEGCNGWSLYDNDGGKEKDVLGTVRWQTLLNNVLNSGRGLIFYREPAITKDGKLHHNEIVPRIYDGKQEVLASEFMPWLRQLQLSVAFDKYLVLRIFPLLKEWSQETLAFSVNVDSLIDPSFIDWLYKLMQEQGKSFCSRILLEITESDVEQYLEQLIPAAQKLKSVGCNLAVVQAGGSNMANISYIQKLPIKVIKLYSGLIRHIKTFSENGLMVDSFCSACVDSDIEIFASGIRYQDEWDILMEKGIVGGQGNYCAAPERVKI